MLNMQARVMMDTLDQFVVNDVTATIDDIDLDDLVYHNTDPNSDQMLSEDIWNKFGFDFPFGEMATNSIDELLNDIGASIPDSVPLPDVTDLCEIRNHDCMWAGHCISKEHTEEHKLLKSYYRPRALSGVVAPGLEKTPAVKQQPVAAGRSLLLKTVIKAAPPVPVLPSPESPPISDDEDTKGQTSTLKMLNDAINECDIAEDSDLCEYFEEGGDIVADPDEDEDDEEEEEEVEEEEEDEEEEDEQEEEQTPQYKPPPQPARPIFAAEADHSYHDHSYHKDKNASMRMANLGIETPSDSEEEIDVVSIGEKQNVFNNRLGYALPTNPSNRDRQQLQRRVASAITNNRRTPPTGGIKTIPPVRKCSTIPSTPTKRRMPESTRSVKRVAKHYYRTPNQTSSKRRAIQAGHNSDSEPESEKRSLHNNMERQRRIDLRNAFEDLRMLVPEVSSRERAAKVVILREAASYCNHLDNVAAALDRTHRELDRKQQYLRTKLSRLRRNLANTRNSSM